MVRHNRRSGPERQARLKQQFAALYPGVVAGEWLPAWLLAEQLVRSAERKGRSPGVRVCDPAHCDFRGGGPRPPELKNLRTRVMDNR